jgi:hypothetical protein
MNSSHYSRYVVTGPPGAKVPQGLGVSGYAFQNGGYIWALKYVGDGGIFFCPSFRDANNAFSSAFYSPLLTTDRTTGDVRSSYLYNPRTKNAGNQPGPVNYYRRYKKENQIQPHKLFAVDVIQGRTFWGHYPERGFQVLFTDGAASFAKADAQVIQWNLNGSYTDSRILDQMFDRLEDVTR